MSFAGDYPGGAAVLMSTFRTFSKDGVFVIPDAKALFENNAPPPNITTIETETLWPNMVTFLPPDTFPHNDDDDDDAVSGFVLVAGGFLVPGKGKGTVDIYEVRGAGGASFGPRVQVSAVKPGWFYHHAEPRDLNGDGRADILAARATKPALPWQKASGELVWFEQPAAGALNASAGVPWPEHVLATGPGAPDVDFLFEDLDGDGREELVATEFFSAKKLALFSCREKSWAACGTAAGQTPLDEVDVDASGDGPFFALSRVDLNGDGRKDLLVTNNRADGKGSVFAYEQPADLSRGNWTRHTLATGFAPKKGIIPMPGLGAPGIAQAVRANATATGVADGKPLVLLSTDDGGAVVLLTPASAAPGDWGYAQSPVCSGTGTVGTPAVGDANGDGITDFFVPFYKDSKVEVWSF